MGRSQPGAANPNWKGGRTVTPDGYVLIKQPDHPNADVRGYVYEHVLVASAHLGRPLAVGEEVHHRNENRADNRLENLEVTDRPHHRVHHRKRTDLRHPDAPNPSTGCECGCGATFQQYDSENRPRRFVSGHNTRVR
jgi:hypothetical protein